MAGAKNKKAIALVMVLLFIVGAVICAKLVWIQIVNGSEYEAKALNNRLKELKMQPNRGVIYDRNGNALAISIECYSVYITPKNVRNAENSEDIVKKLSEVLGLEEENVWEKVNKTTGFEYIKRRITDEQALELKECNFRGVGFTTEYRRSYPKGTLASHVLGFAGIDNQGLAGLELYYDKELMGTPGKLLLEVDNDQNNIPQSQQEFIPAIEGQSLVLTIDETIQYILERELQKVFTAQNADGATGIVMDVNTCAILGIANFPNFDPNSYNDVPAEVWSNFAINGTYEPGSTFKMISSSMFLEEGATTPNDHYTCAGSLQVSGRRFKCWRSYDPHGDQTFAQAVGNSCNPVMAQVALKMGYDAFYAYLDGFGLTTKTNIDLPGEAIGLKVNKDKAVDIDLASMSIGQSNTYTPIQMITAISAVANGGYLMQPYVVEKIIDNNGDVLVQNEPVKVRQVISEETSIQMREILQGVVDEGTGKRGAVEGYKIAGKTGTAQKVVNGAYSETDYICSFAGFAPADKPEIAVLIFVDTPRVESMGSLVAGPVFAHVMEDVLKYLGIEPSVKDVTDSLNDHQTQDTITMPDVSGLSGVEGINFFLEEGLNPIVITQGEELGAYLPLAGTEVQKGSDVYLYCVSESEMSIAIPDISGMTIKEVDKVLSGLGFGIKVDGSGIAYEQFPQAGTIVQKGTQIEVHFKTP